MSAVDRSSGAVRGGDVPVAVPARAPRSPWLVWVLAAASFGLVLRWAADFGCPLLGLTGIPCPFCGMSRAMLSALTGRWELALWYNPLIGVLPLVALCAAPALVSRRWRSGLVASLRRPVPLVLIFCATWAVTLLWAHP